MIEEFNHALTDYQAKWQNLISNRQNKAFFQDLKAVAIGWKVADREEYDRLYSELHGNCERIIETWMNGRWVAKMLLKDSTLTEGIRIVKLMERRPGSSDATGLDHVDFYSPEVAQAELILQKEADLKWAHESNDIIDNYSWISIWFDSTEAKLKDYTVLDTIRLELEEDSKKIKE